MKRSHPLFATVAIATNILCLGHYAAFGAALPPQTFGSMLVTSAANNCGTGGSNQTAEFERSGTGPALVGPAEFTYVVNSNYFFYGGIATLTFSSKSAGTATPDVVPDGAPATIAFSKYKQTVDNSAATLTVTFTLNFPSCNVPMQYLFHTAP